MDWSNERYVRIYTRDTLTWKILKWEGQTVLMHLSRRLDRAGVVDIGEVSPVDAVVALTDLPFELVEVGLKRCLEREVFVLDGDRILMPNYIEAQEAEASNAERQRRYRALRKALRGNESNASGNKSLRDSNETLPDRNERNGGSNGSNGSSNSVPSVPSVPKDICPPPWEDESRSVGPKIVEGIKVATNVKRKPRPEERALWEFWRKTMSKSDAHVLDNKRLLAMARSLANHTLVEMQKVVLGCRNSKYHMGENDSQTKYNDIELICRDEKHFTAN